MRRDVGRESGRPGVGKKGKADILRTDRLALERELEADKYDRMAGVERKKQGRRSHGAERCADRSAKEVSDYGMRTNIRTDGGLALDDLDDPRSGVGRPCGGGAETNDMEKGGLLVGRGELCGLVVQGGQGDHEADAIVVVLGEL